MTKCGPKPIFWGPIGSGPGPHWIGPKTMGFGPNFDIVEFYDRGGHALWDLRTIAAATRAPHARHRIGAAPVGACAHACARAARARLHELYCTTVYSLGVA